MNIIVTPALSSPSIGILKGYKPKDGIKFRGNYWTLTSWWKNHELIEEHKPEPYDPLKRYE